MRVLWGHKVECLFRLIWDFIKQVNIRVNARYWKSSRAFSKTTIDRLTGLEKN